VLLKQSRQGRRRKPDARWTNALICFASLDQDEQLEFPPTCTPPGRSGWADLELDGPAQRFLNALFKLVLEHLFPGAKANRNH